MYCTKKITDSLIWVGGNDRRLAMFEGVYSVPTGVSYNSYLLVGEQTVLFDTVDSAVSRVFFENIEHELGDKPLDYVVVHHMEPDHSATLGELALRYPDVTVICNAKTEKMLGQFFPRKFKTQIVNEGDKLTLASHELTFISAPMVHWPEVMMTYDATDKVLFSADAFGAFGALNGAIFADEVNFDRDYLDEARRYYTNIVGKYGAQVQSVLKKATALDIKYLCPLHGFVWRESIGYFIDKYDKWSRYEPEEEGVVIAYASIYGNTENAAEIISSRLRERGIKTVMFDVSVTPASDIISAVFKYSHLLLASATYNAGIFVQMEAFLSDLVSHNIQNKTVAIVENGSWAPTAGKQMREMLAKCKNINLLEQTLTVRSSLSADASAEIDSLVNALASTFTLAPEVARGEIDTKALFKLSYGLFLLTAADGEKHNGCIINTAIQVTSRPLRISIAVNNQNLTHDIIIKTGKFNISVLTEQTPFEVFSHFGMKSGRNTDKFENCADAKYSANGLIYLPKYTNAMLSGSVISSVDLGTHTMFIADVTEALTLDTAPSATYDYYFKHIKPQPATPKKKESRVWVCNICGYAYDEAVEGVPFEELPENWLCPLCKHPKSDFSLQA